jgi:dsDNA-binding SOS-regulon protein
MFDIEDLSRILQSFEDQHREIILRNFEKLFEVIQNAVQYIESLNCQGDEIEFFLSQKKATFEKIFENLKSCQQQLLKKTKF